MSARGGAPLSQLTFSVLIKAKNRLRDQLEIVGLHRPVEQPVFSEGQLAPMLELGKAEIRRIGEIQRSILR
jgi:hypothetical protein